MSKPLKQFVITLEDWTPDIMDPLDSVLIKGKGTFKSVPDGSIAVIKEDHWLTEEDLIPFLRESGAEAPEISARDMFGAFLAFNGRAADFNRQATGALVELRLDIDSNRRMIAASSVAALSQDMHAEELWFNNSVICDYLKGWVDSFTATPATI